MSRKEILEALQSSPIKTHTTIAGYIYLPKSIGFLEEIEADIKEYQIIIYARRKNTIRYKRVYDNNRYMVPLEYTRKEIYQRIKEYGRPAVFIERTILQGQTFYKIHLGW